MSAHTCRVVKLNREEIHKNPDSDHLYYLQVPQTGYTCCIRGVDWLNNDGTLKHSKAAYLEPQTVLNTDLPQFNFLKTDKDKSNKYRVRAKRLRGINSFGFLCPVSEEIPEGYDFWQEWNLERWEAEIPEQGGDNRQNVKGPPKDFSKYDVENIKNYMNAFTEGEKIVALQKLNGQNMRVCCDNNEIFVGSRNYWKMDNESSDFWRSYRAVPGLEKCVKENNHLCVFGESYGNNAKWREDCPEGERRFRAFDIFDSSTGNWLDWFSFQEICIRYSIPICPMIFNGPFNFQQLLNLVELDSPLKVGQAMEGLVIWPEKCDYHPKLGRRKAKLISLRYEERS